ncbi:MAG: TIGR00366 family protein [Gammaproteobacteria bacterium]|jgi:short-chain fatty acids transporter|nr:TIGR00366 family protein [Gammaproteobacteria bacterium]
MLSALANLFSQRLRRWIPDPFVFALALTLLVGGLALVLTDADAIAVVDGWYRGFWMLLEFGMQMVLILATGFAIALSPPAARLIDRLARFARTPGAVYVIVLVAGGLFNLVSWGWTVLAAVLGRELAKRVPGVDYAYLVACVYLSGQPWVGGASSSIPLLLNTEGNFLIESGVLDGTIATSQTLGSSLNLLYIAMYFATLPLLMWLMRPAPDGVRTLDELRDPQRAESVDVAEEAESLTLDGSSLSDRLNNSVLLTLIVGLLALGYVVRHFAVNGFSIDLNIMIFLFIALGLIAHRTPMRYGLAMKRACANAFGIIYQYPFYAGIMGVMMFSGLGAELSLWLAAGASLETLPLVAQFAGAAINFAIPSAGGEWAVIGPALTETALALSAHLPADQQQAYVARIAMSVAYGETSTNLVQPFFLLAVLPVMGAGVLIHARDVMGYLLIPFVIVYTLTAALVTWVPI